MNKIKANMAISLDGYIAHKDGETDWIPAEVAIEISEILHSSKFLLAGSNTYNAIFEQSGGYWPYKNTYVISHYDNSALSNKNLQFLFDDPMGKIKEIKEKATGDTTVIGGGKLLTSLINTRLLDELNLYLIPVLLGDGIRFLGKTFDTNIKCISSEYFNGLTKISYYFN